LESNDRKCFPLTLTLSLQGRGNMRGGGKFFKIFVAIGGEVE